MSAPENSQYMQSAGAPEITSAMIDAGTDVLIGCFGPDYYGNDEKYRRAAVLAYRAMVSNNFKETK